MQISGLHEPSFRTRTYVEEALKAFHIPSNSIQIYSFDEDGIIAGWADSEGKIIALQENLDDIDCEYTSYHEAAHIKDEATRKIQLHAKYLSTTVLYTGLLALWYNLHATPKKLLRSPFFNLLAYLQTPLHVASYTIACDWFHHKYAIGWASEQAELRADKMAVEKLIEQEKLGPILVKLLDKKFGKYLYGNIKLKGHPRHDTEYKAIKKTIQSYGYNVKKYRPIGNPNDLVIEISKNGYTASATSRNFYTKV
jgi:hypothetical protein